MLNIATKVVLGALLVHAVVASDLAQYQDKGMGYRVVLYPIAAALVPAVWALARRRRATRRRPYPDLIDLCVVAPFLLDTAGNAADLYDRISWFDDALHLLNWIPLVVAFGLLLRYWPLSRPVVAGLTLGFGAVTHILWELGEYLTFVADSPTESASAYRDTIGDLAGSLLGSAIGAALVATVLWNVGAVMARDLGDPVASPGRSSAAPSDTIGRAVAETPPQAC